MRKDENGFGHLFSIILVLVVVTMVFAGWYVFSKNNDKNVPKTDSVDTQQEVEEVAEADSADTLNSPEKIVSSDGKTYFSYGAPAGQNNKSPKKIIISLPGHGTLADDGYQAWSGHLEGTGYAIAEFNWWDGEGETMGDYYSPTKAVGQIREFLKDEGYTSGDVVVLHGFSRGSANTYAVIVSDKQAKAPVFDAVISNSGKYQSDFPLSAQTLSDSQITRLFNGIPWVLSCGGTDPNPERDGCAGMTETNTWLEAHGVNVLALLTDPNLGHGAFHKSTLELPKQALTLIDEALDLAL